MIFDEFQLGILNALNGDAYFSQAPSVLIVPEEALLPDTTGMDDAARDAALEAARENHRKQVQNALNTNGVAAVVSELDFESSDSPDLFVARCTIAWFENRKKSSASKPNRSARNSCAKAHAILQRYVVPISKDGERVDPFSKILIKSNNFIGEEDGTAIREIVLESMISVCAVETALADESGFILVTENDQGLQVEPTSP